MPRLRLGVVLMFPPAIAAEIDGLRRALGDRALGRVAPHCTLVPPVNVRVADVPAALELLRDAAAGSSAARSGVGSFTVDLGPVRSFAPVTDTLFLSVSQDRAEPRDVHELREAVFRGPFARELDHPFVPHVTVADETDAGRLAHASAVLRDCRLTAGVDRLHLLEEQRVDGRRRWVPVADVPFCAPAVVGRGGIDLELTDSRLVDLEARALLAGAADDDAVVPAPPAGAEPVVVTARRAAAVVGVGWGWRHPQLGGEVDAVRVHPDHRGLGADEHIRARLEWLISA